MPNYCYCTLTFEGAEKDIIAVKRKISSVNEHQEIIAFDFNEVTPMPAELSIAHHSDGELWYKHQYLKKPLLDHEKARLENMTKKEKKEAQQLGKQYHENYQKHGYITWYDWCWDHWGTKWNAISLEDEYDIEAEAIEFNTAWSPPIPVITKLSKLFPSVVFILSFRDEFEEEQERKSLLFDNGNITEV